ncbi:hypothetical protein DVH24_026082 [Malus domestica]|uniref:Uncharacterized protein n=1 Tax=Malus domestica TaxID=3750 RepID=A0A498KHS0_MALDO|nr:hypothetical protein DVH24_026082 [Malus domestica]
MLAPPNKLSPLVAIYDSQFEPLMVKLLCQMRGWSYVQNPLLKLSDHDRCSMQLNSCIVSHSHLFQVFSLLVWGKAGYLGISHALHHVQEL